MSIELDTAARRATAFASYDELLVNARSGYVPTLHPNRTTHETVLRAALIKAGVAVWPEPSQTELEQMTCGWNRRDAAALLARHGYVDERKHRALTLRVR